MEPQQDSGAGTAGAGTERIAAFSDGVIAIIITIMVLELKLPDTAAKGDIWANFLSPLAPKIAVYALSFLIVGAMWINHHQLLAVVKRPTPLLMWLNLLLLFLLSLIPLATGFLGEHPLLARAIMFYAVNMALCSAAFGLLRYSIGWMPDHDRDHVQLRHTTLLRSVTATLLNAIAALTAIVSPVAALALLVLAPILFNISMLLGRERPA